MQYIFSKRIAPLKFLYSDIICFDKDKVKPFALYNANMFYFALEMQTTYKTTCYKQVVLYVVLLLADVFNECCTDSTGACEHL